MHSIGVLGGTFDPIHNGHIRLALEVRNKLKLDTIKLIPANIPPHRSTPLASANDRKKMVELAILDQENLSIDLREIENKNISYTVNTLISLRVEFPNDALFLIVGEDVFNMIDTWKDWQSILNYTHIIVATRLEENKKNISDELKVWRKKNEINDIKILKMTQSGHVFYINTPIVEISSRMIREYYSQKKIIDEYLPSNIISYIKENNLYMDN
ncbi:uncharacterized protein METZ01_LOCUS469463 [marine metagenome]|uniref:Cytidyltransferase-like domain-containing protein n=1 Tax=marine metagenome TaxID=408172 RepID=A0A383BA21_9ZZZZ|tara:strand:+ start:388 stop:1029 length:642 start_codon:yes stop_codon:yes gene_type:complete